MSNGFIKRFWRCNQWWNQKCRARVYTINDEVTLLQDKHTHEEVVKRKKRMTKREKINSLSVKQEFVYRIKN